MKDSTKAQGGLWSDDNAALPYTANMPGNARHTCVGIAQAALCKWVEDILLLQVHAACCGVWGFRASSGIALADSKGAVAGSLEAVGWACQDPRDLQLVGDALKLPGSELSVRKPPDMHYVACVSWQIRSPCMPWQLLPLWQYCTKPLHHTLVIKQACYRLGALPTRTTKVGHPRGC